MKASDIRQVLLSDVKFFKKVSLRSLRKVRSKRVLKVTPITIRNYSDRLREIEKMIDLSLPNNPVMLLVSDMKYTILTKNSKLFDRFYEGCVKGKYIVRYCFFVRAVGREIMSIYRLPEPVFIKKLKTIHPYLYYDFRKDAIQRQLSPHFLNPAVQVLR